MERLNNTPLKDQFYSLKCPNDINHNPIKPELYWDSNEGDSQKLFSNSLNTGVTNVTVKLETEDLHEEYPRHSHYFQEISECSSQSVEIKQEADEDVDDLFVEGFEQNDFGENQDLIKLENEETSQKLIKPEIEDEVDVMEFKVEEDCIDFYAAKFEDNLTDMKSESGTSYYDSEVDVTKSDYDNDTMMKPKTVKLKSLNNQKHSTHNRKKKGESNNNNNNEKIKHCCTYCAYETSSKSYLQIHIALHEDPSQLVWYRCPQCSYKTRQKSHLKRHEHVHLDPDSANQFICHICSSGFKQKCSLRRHIQFVHRDIPGRQTSKASETKFHCSSCDYSTYKKDLLVSHLDKHKKKDSYICGICHFSTKYRRNLRMHLETHVESEALKVFECKMCKYSTRLRRCLTRHLLSKKHLAVVGRLSDYRPRGVKD